MRYDVNWIFNLRFNRIFPFEFFVLFLRWDPGFFRSKRKFLLSGFELCGLHCSSSSSVHPKQVVGGCEHSSTVISVTESVIGTREQTRREQIERDTDETLSAESECVPSEVDCILDFPESYFEEDPQITPVAELCTWPEVEEVDIPLPNTVGRGSDRDLLVAEQQSDGTLKQVLELARKGEKGYEVIDNLLVQSMEDGLGDCKQWVVV